MHKDAKRRFIIYFENIYIEEFDFMKLLLCLRYIIMIY